VPQFTEEQNETLYGKCNNPYGHGHDYELEVTVAGPIDADSGLVCPLPVLDRLVQENILRTMAHRNLNRDLPQFSKLVPTTENLTAVIAELLQTNWAATLGSRVKLHRVHIQETDRNGFEIFTNPTAGFPVHA
jgi:6-pyruvoyltetrahydropterin/6-carboxytetrahydropterin synthase